MRVAPLGGTVGRKLCGDYIMVLDMTTITPAMPGLRQNFIYHKHLHCRGAIIVPAMCVLPACFPNTKIHVFYISTI